MAKPPAPQDQTKIQAHHLEIQQFTQVSFLPPPEMLESYEKIQPGLTERIVKITEAEVAHRHSQEIKMLDSDIEVKRNYQKEVRLGQWLGFSIGAIAVGAGTVAAINGAEWFGSIMGGGGITSLVLAFIYGRKQSQNQPPKNNQS